jgi:hypothetical protein
MEIRSNDLPWGRRPGLVGALPLHMEAIKEGRRGKGLVDGVASRSKSRTHPVLFSYSAIDVENPHV